GAIRSYLQRHDKQISPEKSDLYMEIVVFWQTYNGEQKRLVERLSEWLPRMQLWACDDVLKQFLSLCDQLQKEDASQDSLKKGFGKLIMEIRKDMGYRNRGLKSSYFDM
ncbi:hypothetical protein QLX67_12330, partial [Balneolaceae bacterium ANBcel3]|nr:hypothetical protein [Balneolaceae bacterium ANBcel3]